MEHFSIGPIDLGDGLPALLIAEIGLNHNGSAELAHQHIDAAARSGANMVKFQKRCPDALATADFLDRPFHKCPQFGRTQRQVRERLELSLDDMRACKEHAEELGLLFTTSVFDIPSVEFALQLSPDVLKVASHSITNGPLLTRLAETRIPLIVSVGGAAPEEIDQALALLKDSPLVLMHCVSAYPTPENLVFLDTIQDLATRYGKHVGFSGHEDGIEACVAAVTLGAKLIERHFTLSRQMVGLDHRVSLEPAEFAEMARMIRRIERMRGVKPGILPQEHAARLNYHVALCANQALPAGTRLTEEMLTTKQPLEDPAVFFTGLERDRLVGKTLTQTVTADTRIRRSWIEGEAEGQG